MPVEIKELVIRTVVGGSAPEPRDETVVEHGGGQATVDPDRVREIVQECVRQVMRILAKNKER